MTTIEIILLVAGSVSGYGILTGITRALLPDTLCGDSDFPWIAAIFWPIGGPVGLGVLLGRSIKRRAAAARVPEARTIKR